MPREPWRSELLDVPPAGTCLRPILRQGAALDRPTDQSVAAQRHLDRRRLWRHLVTSAALNLFLAFIALSRVPTTDVKILATALALGIIIDATIVRGILAPALVAALGPVNWWMPGRAAKPLGESVSN